MKLQFESNQQYQLDAIQAIVDIFEGQSNGEYVAIGGQSELEIEGQQLSLEAVSTRGNKLSLSSRQVTANTHSIQKKLGLPLSELTQNSLLTEYDETLATESGESLLLSEDVLKDGMNFSIEMETGTGKTYVYLRTIHELHRTYGWKKFIIVVPSVAIREGVLKNLEITREHFAELYSKPEMNYYVWDAKKRGQAREFATNDTLQIMVITIDSFAKSENVMNKRGDYGKPLDYIKATNPVVIIDEPQNMETNIRKNAIGNLNPLCTFRYSATHKNVYNMLYRLTPVDAYDKGLVKKIEVHSVYSEDSFNDAYVSLIKLEKRGKSNLIAHVELDASDERGLQRKIVKAKLGDDFEDIAGRSIYEGYIVEAIDPVDNAIEFANGKTVYLGQKDENLHEEILKRQIELTIEDHFEKQRKLNAEGIKVLSLFFIDKVANYREYNDDGYVNGRFAKWFEEAYEKISQKPKWANVLDGLKANEVHNGYFAADKSGRWKDSRDSKDDEGGKTKDDDNAYNLIMKDKERLLDMNEPLRFIFSHSALREGWDNPNVFNICTLNETSSEMKKRQEIGRGLRLPVNSMGERVRDESINVLTVIANESYSDFSKKLQTEMKDETGTLFDGRIKNRDDRRRMKLVKSLALDPSFKELWDRIKYKTKYSILFNEEKLVERVVEQLADVDIFRPQISNSRNFIESMEGGFKSQETIGSPKVISKSVERIPNVLEAIQKRTYMTRHTIFSILDKARMTEKIPINPQQVIDVVSETTNRVKTLLAVDGIKYEKTGEEYRMELFENSELEAYLYDTAATAGAVEVKNQDKTVYNYVSVDSQVEYSFMKALEGDENVKFYIKLPNWFAIDTPLGKYNPDWAVVFQEDEKIYFVAETKSTNDIHDTYLRGGEPQKIRAGRQHFHTLDVPYVAPVDSLHEAIQRLSR